MKQYFGAELYGTEGEPVTGAGLGHRGVVQEFVRTHIIDAWYASYRTGRPGVHPVGPGLGGVEVISPWAEQRAVQPVG